MLFLVDEGYAFHFVESAIDIADKVISGRDQFVCLFLCQPPERISFGKRLELPRFVISGLDVAIGRIKSWVVVVSAGPWHIVDGIQVALGLAVLGPGCAFRMVFSLDVLEEEMQSFPFLLVELEAVEDFGVALDGFKLVAVIGVVADGLALFLLDLIDVDDFCQFFEPILHANGHFIVLFGVIGLIALGDQRIHFILWFFSQALAPRLLEPGLDALEDGGEFLIDLDDQSIVVFADGFEFGLDDGERDIVLPWANGRAVRFIGQIACYLRFENRRRTILGRYFMRLREQPLSFLHCVANYNLSINFIFMIILQRHSKQSLVIQYKFNPHFELLVSIIYQFTIMSSDSEERSQSRSKSAERSRSRSREKRNTNEGKERKVKIKVPELTSNLYSFKHFTSLQTEKMNPDTIQKGYDKYKKDWEHRQHEQFINQVRNEPWFNEKYNPELLDAQERERKDYVKRLSEEFLARFENGHYEKLDLRISDVTQLGTIFQPDEEEEYQSTSNSFISNQTIEIHINSGVDISKPPYYGFAPDSCTLFIRSLSREIARNDIRSIVEKLDGFRTLTMSDPLKKANFTRNCWIQFGSEEQCERASLSMNGLMIKNETLNVSKAFTKVRKVKVLKNYPIGRLESDGEMVGRLVERFDANCGITTNDLPSRPFPSTQRRHDTLLLYLRRVHSFDYYTCTHFENERVLSLRTGAIFLRIEADYEELPNMQTVFRKVQQNAEEKLQAMAGGDQEYMALVREEVERFIRDTEKVAPGAVRDIWKCFFCDKKFKTCEFLSKHMISRHDEVKLKKVTAVMEQLYMKDPNKITNYTIRDENRRKSFGGGFRREKRKEVYRDFDEPEGETQAKPVSKIMVNFLDI